MPELLAAPNEAPAPLHPSQNPDFVKVPVDEYGMPYLLYPYEAPGGLTERWDGDHGFFFSDMPELSDSAGQALRFSRVQEVPRWLHDRKHNVHYRGGVESLPQTENDKFALTVLACAGYVSRTALDLRGSEPKLVRMKGKVYDFVSNPDNLYVQKRRDNRLDTRTSEHYQRRIGSFFADYIRRQQLDDVVSDKVLDRFLNTKSREYRARMGNYIIDKAIRAAVEPIEPKYRDALQNGLVRARVKHAVGVVAMYFPRERWADYHDALSRELVAA